MVSNQNPIGGAPISASPSFLGKKVVIRDTRIDLVNVSRSDVAAISKFLTVYDTYSKWPRALWRAVTERQEGDVYVASVPRYMPRRIFSECINGSFEVVRDNNDHLDPGQNLDITFNGEPRSDLQIRAINYMFDQNWNFREPTRTLDLPVGEGKTFLALYAMSILKRKPLIIVHKVPMIDTPWKKDIQAFTNIQPDEICVIKGEDSIEKALKNPSKYKAFIAVHRTLENFLNRNGAYEAFRDLISKLGIGFTIIDEAHKELLSSFLISMYNPCPFTLYITATLGRTDYQEAKVFSVLLPIERSFASNNYVGARKFVTYCPRPFTSHPSDKWVKTMSNATGVKMNLYCNYICEDEEAIVSLYDGITTAISEIFKADKNAKIAILLGTLELVQRIRDGLVEDFGADKIGNFTSLIPAKQRVKELEKQIIISTEKSMDSAIDTEVNALIMCVPITSEVQITQIIGRIRYKEDKPDRKYLVYDIVDTSFKKTLRNYKERAKIIKRNICAEEA
jgi:superfamily II DNA or RNA helicase